MQIKYKITGGERKSLVNAISQELNAPAMYLGAPTFAYEVGGYSIDKAGTLTGEDNWELVADLSGLHSFVAVEESYDTALAQSTDEAPAIVSFGGGIQPNPDHDYFTDGPHESDCEPLDTLTIEMPIDDFTEEALSNLEKLVASKATLIKKAIGADALSIERTESTLKFPWFRLGVDADEAAAYSRFISTLCSVAKEQHRVTAKEKAVDNEKYAFRCFLLRLGFIGSEYKEVRKILLRYLSGNGAFKSKPSANDGEVSE